MFKRHAHHRKHHRRRLGRRQARRTLRSPESLEFRTLLNAAPIATPDVYTMPAEVATVREAPGWLINDSDSDGDAVQVNLLTQPAHGLLSWQPDGQWTYEPKNGYVGVDQLEYQATDGELLSEPTPVHFRVGRYAELILADSPVAYWPLGESSDESIVEDRSGNGFRGEYKNVQVGHPGAIVAETNTAAHFGSGGFSNVYLGGPDRLLQLQNRITIEAWVRPSSLSSHGRIFANSQHDYDRGIGFGLFDDRLIFTSFGIKDYISRPVIHETDRWYHVAVTVDEANDAFFYVDGQLVDQIEGTTIPRLGSHAALLGSKSGNNERFHGLLNEVAIFDNVLSQDQIAQHFLMGSTHDGPIPRPVDDHYVIEQDRSLRVDVAQLDSPRHSFSDDFSSGRLNPNLEDPTHSFVVRNGRLQAVDERQYVRTVKSDYTNGDFVIEVDVEVSTTDRVIEFVGIGPGERSSPYDEPADAAYLRLHSVGFDGEVIFSAAGPFGGTKIGKIDSPGTHRVRLTKSGLQLTVEVDAHFDGLFRPDISHTIDDFAQYAPFLDDLNSRVILGGSTLSNFDNLRVESSLDPSVSAGVLANDLAIDQEKPVAVELVDGPDNGTVQLASDGTFEYSPAAGFAGSDSFAYRVDDGGNRSDLGTAWIDIYSPRPIANNDQYSVAEDTLLLIDQVSTGLLANDGDRNELPLGVQLVAAPAHGELILQDDGRFSYQPSKDFSGTDSFTYVATNGNFTSSEASVDIRVQPVNDAPLAFDDRYVLDDERTISVTAADGVLANDSDVDTETLLAAVIEGPVFGELTLGDDGSLQYTAGDTFHLTDHFTYLVSDGENQSEPATVELALDTPTIEVQDAVLMPNLPDQQVQLTVTGGHTVSGIDLFVQVGDGGPELVDLGLPAGERGPRITSVDLKSGTIFQNVSDGAFDLGSLPQLANWSIALADGGSVLADGLLATLTIDTTGIFEGDWDLRLAGLLPNHSLGPIDTSFSRMPAFTIPGTVTVMPTEVVGRHLFYNNSDWDGDDDSGALADDAAIATDKRPLLPGQSATFENYSSYVKGINGVILDIRGISDAKTVQPDDFKYRMGRSNDLTSWQPAPAPNLTVRLGEGADGSDRFTLTWPDNAIQQTWLEISIPAGARTGLGKADVFYFGNAIGETGNAAENTLVTSIDVIATRDNQQGPFSPADVTNVYDFNRDRIVSATDVIIARDHQVGPLAALPIIAPPLAMEQPAPAQAAKALQAMGARPGDSNRDGQFDSRDLVLIFQNGLYEDPATSAQWIDGDWNADGIVDSTDLVRAFQAGGYESIALWDDGIDFRHLGEVQRFVEEGIRLSDDERLHANVQLFGDERASRLRKSDDR